MAKKMKTMDGNQAASYVSYAFTEVAAIYPITPSSNMAENVDEWAASGQKNIFGQQVKVVEMQSEAGAAGAVHGSLAAGILTSTYTCSQGLLLMIPNMYKIAGELLPGVFHVSARAVAAHALSIFGDHQDVMATRQTGFAMLASGSVQETMDLAGVAHLSSIKGKVPFLHFFDGFRTSHEVQKIEVIDYADFAKLVDWDAIQSFRDHALNPDHPVTRGTAQNPDIYFQGREASNKYYDAIPGIVVNYMNEINKITGREYKPFNYYGAPDAENVMIAMGSVTETAEEVVDYLNAKGGKVGVVKVHLYRPFIAQYFMDVLPKTVKKIVVMDRTKEPGAPGEPLYLDIRNMFYDVENSPKIIGGRYGLGSKDVTPNQLIAVFENLVSATPRNGFTVGINDDVTNLSLPVGPHVNTSSKSTKRCKFWGLGSDGTVGANKNAIKIIGDNTDMYAQGYFAYDSKKSGGVTISHLRFGKDRIRSTYLIDEADFIACHNQAYVNQYDLLTGLKKGGTFLLNTKWTPEELGEKLPATMKQYLAKNEINFYTINATDIAAEIGLGNRINMITQAAFFKLSEVIPLEDAIRLNKEAVVKSYGKKGEKIVSMNNAAIDKGIDAAVKITIPADWATATEVKAIDVKVPAFIENVLVPMNRQEGDKLPVSTFNGIEDGTFPMGTAAFEKRGIAVNVPEWQPSKCIQCNQCSFVCPHAVIRPVLANAEELKKAPATFETLKASGKGFEEYNYRLSISPMDCTGCGNCADICPAKEKALVMKGIETQTEAGIPNWNFGLTIPVREDLMNVETVKGSQFAQPLIEFSGACAGCGETPYIKVITQLFGDRMMIANATGCSSIWGASAPATPYTKNACGKGPSWANSLFEDNAEYGFGMAMGVKQMVGKLTDLMNEGLTLDMPADVKTAMTDWLGSVKDANATKKTSAALVEVLNKANLSGKAAEIKKEILAKKDFLIKKSVWVLGGDGWAYDIGFGGLDHVIASGENINILVFDTEVYSNTGGQASKSTPVGAVAKFAASGMRIKKKDLGAIAMSYGYVYVAQTGMGYDKNQFMKAITEAEQYDGPSLIICYAPCINHGLREGMGRTQANMKQAVEAGYWHLYRFNPALKEEGKNPFSLDSKEPTASFRDFLLAQTRYTSLMRSYPAEAEVLFTRAEEDANEKLASLKKRL